MRLSKYLTEIKNLTIKDETTGAYSGQTNATLTAYLNDEPVGYLDYQVYGKEVSIAMVKGSPTVKGVGRELVLHLQSLYPRTEINWGGMTGKGFKLFKSLKGKLYVDTKRRNTIASLKRELQALDKEEKILQRDLKKAPPGSSYMEMIGNRFNQIEDRRWEIEQELNDLE
jgi:hypothetical protein